MTLEINIVIEGRFKDCPASSWLQQVAAAVLKAESVAGMVEMGLVIAGQKRIRELNRIYRGKDAPTDVLSFYLEGEGNDAFVVPPDGVRHLGEVIISYPQARLQAKRQGHSVREELALLITHGVLHLLGYDHEAGAPQERQMRSREKAILDSLEGLLARV